MTYVIWMLVARSYAMLLAVYNTVVGLVAVGAEWPMALLYMYRQALFVKIRKQLFTSENKEN